LKWKHKSNYFGTIFRLQYIQALFLALHLAIRLVMRANRTNRDLVGEIGIQIVKHVQKLAIVKNLHKMPLWTKNQAVFWSSYLTKTLSDCRISWSAINYLWKYFFAFFPRKKDFLRKIKLSVWPLDSSIPVPTNYSMIVEKYGTSPMWSITKGQ
jgi:hypothetical protein